MAETDEKKENLTIAAFDFDGTITVKDSLWVFILYSINIRRIFIGTVKIVPYLVAYKLGKITNSQAKEKLFSAFFKGMTLTDFNLQCVGFAASIGKMLRPAAIEKIRWHQQMGHEVIIISASVENWIKPWAQQNGIVTVLATQIQVQNGVLTGNFLSENCHGQEKVNRLLNYLDKTTDYVLYAYGDSSGDKELLKLANHPFYRNF